MGTDSQTRIVKQGMAASIRESRAVSEERQKEDAMAEFKGRRRLDPGITFQTLFKEALV
jgi:hypothetical protein